MFWFIYLTASILVSLVIARLNKRYYFESLIFLLIFFLTPAQIEASRPDYAPSVFTFIFNLFFQQEFSTRAVRPLILSLSLYLALLSLYLLIKRRFF